MRPAVAIDVLVSLAYILAPLGATVVVVVHAIDFSCIDVGASSAAFDPTSRLRLRLSHHSHQKRLFRQHLLPRQMFLLLRL